MSKYVTTNQQEAIRQAWKLSTTDVQYGVWYNDDDNKYYISPVHEIEEMIDSYLLREVHWIYGYE